MQSPFQIQSATSEMVSIIYFECLLAVLVPQALNKCLYRIDEQNIFCFIFRTPRSLTPSVTAEIHRKSVLALPVVRYQRPQVAKEKELLYYSDVPLLRCDICTYDNFFLVQALAVVIIDCMLNYNFDDDDNDFWF